MGQPASFVTSASTEDVNTFLRAQTFSGGISVTGALSLDATDASGTPGAATINKPAGKVAIAIGASSVVVTNSLVTSASIVLAVLQFADATANTIRSVVPGTGSFTINVNANATAATKVAFVVIN